MANSEQVLVEIICQAMYARLIYVYVQANKNLWH